MSSIDCLSPGKHTNTRSEHFVHSILKIPPTSPLLKHKSYPSVLLNPPSSPVPISTSTTSPHSPLSKHSVTLSQSMPNFSKSFQRKNLKITTTFEMKMKALSKNQASTTANYTARCVYLLLPVSPLVQTVGSSSTNGYQRRYRFLPKM